MPSRMPACLLETMSWDRKNESSRGELSFIILSLSLQYILLDSELIGLEHSLIIIPFQTPLCPAMWTGIQLFLIDNIDWQVPLT